MYRCIAEAHPQHVVRPALFLFIDLTMDKEIAPDPATLRARLKHRAPTPPTTSADPTTASASSSSLSSYDTVLDIARRLSELERERAQDTAYIRSLKLANATLQREKQGAGGEAGGVAVVRARAEAQAACAAEVERVRARVEAERDEMVGRERARAERAEERVRALERLVEEARERVVVLEGVVEGERRRREEWEWGLEEIALDGPRA